MDSLTGINRDDIAGRVAPFLERPWNLNCTTLRSAGWTAMPVEKGRHIEPADAARLAAALRGQHGGDWLAIATEDLGGRADVFRFLPDAHCLERLSKHFAGLSFVIVPSDFGAIMLFTSEDYNIVAGPADFVERAVGTSLAVAAEKFKRFAADDWWNGRMLAVAERYGVVETGTEGSG